jgi:hypothetical protein
LGLEPPIIQPVAQRYTMMYRMDLWEIVWDGVDWVHLAQDMDQWRAVVNTVMDLWVI